MTAKKFLAANPEWASTRFQIDYMATRASNALSTYNGSVKRAIISHNCPDCANHNTDRYVCNLGPAGLKALNGKGYDSSSCLKDEGKIQGYWRDEVNNPRLLSIIRLNQ